MLGDGAPGQKPGPRPCSGVGSLKDCVVPYNHRTPPNFTRHLDLVLSVDSCPPPAQIARQHPGLPPAGLSMETASHTTEFAKPFLLFLLGRSRPGPSRWGTGGLCTPASASGWLRWAVNCPAGRPPTAMPHDFPSCHALYVQSPKQVQEAGRASGPPHTPRASTCT